MIAGVLFDMDGLLLDTEQLYFACFRETVAAFGHPPMDALYLSTLGLPTPAAIAVLQNGFAGRIDLAQFRPRFEMRLETLLADGITTRPGARELLQDLDRRAIPVAIATSTTTERARAHLAQTGLLALVRHVIGGDQVVHGKPAPDIYLKAAKALGLEARHCAAFEDSDNGTHAAVASGARTVQVPDLIDPSPETRALGHHIAPTLLDGARAIGLLAA